ncbi:ABC transporter ATP-binding protein/permease [Streptomyces sp. NBC_01696]|uniref:ABC transporter ATP-binding protein n=1 Tax=unclassified Streptomyces TaxID=2593676 RepID=UPI002E2DBBA5|nr:MULTISPECIES: ABC transporter ATP-binding protein [unclassified Streptomyces]
MRAPRSGPAAFTGFLLIDLVVPLASYYVLRALGASVWTALLTGAALPMLRLSAGLVLRRRVPGASLFVLGLITVGTAIGLMTADSRPLMARESYLTGFAGVWVLLSLLRARPLVFTATVGFMPPAPAEDWHRYWETSETFRRAMRGMTWGFGLAFLIDAAARVVMSYTLPLDLVPATSAALLAMMLVVVVRTGKAWGRRHMRRSTVPPTRPHTRGPWSYLAWLVSRQRGRVTLGAVLGSAWMMGLALPPYVLSRAIDSLAESQQNVVLGWTAVLLLVGGVLAGLSIWRHRTMTRVRMDAALRTVSEVNAHGIRLGDTMARRALTGEVVAIGGGDAWTIGRSLTATGPGVGAVLAYVVIAVLLLRISVPLAVVVLAGVPVLAMVVGPATRRLRTVGTPYREQQSRVTSRIVDIVAGLGVLNGLGGKALYAERFRAESQRLLQHGYRVGRVTSVIQAAGLGLPTLFSAAVVWLAARLAVEGSITVGELVAVAGYAAVLAVPVASFIEGALDLSQALVAARRVTDFLDVRPDSTGTAVPPGRGDLIDEASGLRITPGTFAAVATAQHSDAVALFDRLGGFRPGATWAGQPTSELDPAQLHKQVLVADNDAALFAGSLAQVVAGRLDVADLGEAAILDALHTAAADDVVRGLPEGLGSRIDSGGRNLSGGQRQRVRLARATIADPTVLLAVDPTSALDAATEATVVDRLTHHRRGKTTLVTSTSALVLQGADEVHLLADGRVVASGTHTALLANPAYAALVHRGRPVTIAHDPEIQA